MRSSDWSSDVCSSDLFAHRAPAAGRAMQIIVVEDERLPIGGFLHVQLEAMPGSDGGLERRHAVFHPPVAVQPTVREGLGDQPEQPLLAACTQCLNLRRRRRLHPLPPLRSEGHTSELQSLITN